MAVKSTVQTAYLSCLINHFTFRPKPRTRTPFQLIAHVDQTAARRVDRVVDQLLDRVFLPCRQVLVPLCDHGGEQVPARIVFLHPDRGVAGVGLAEP